jgi:hypothetical protein
MTSIQEEMDDSRTSAVGRKRNLEEILDRDQRQVSLRDSSPEENGQRATKRVKEGEEPLEDVSVEDGLTKTTPLLSDASSSLPTESSQIKASTAAPPRAGAWNKGVQSRLRTSFGNRVHTKPKPTPLISSSQEENIDPTSNPISRSSPMGHPHSSPAIDQGGEHTAMAEAMALPQMQVSYTLNQDGKSFAMPEAVDTSEKQALSTVDQDGDDVAMAETMNLPEKQPLPASDQIRRNGGLASTKLSLPQIGMTLSSGEEGEISSSRGTGEEAGESSLPSDGEDNAGSLEFRASLTHAGDEEPSAGDAFGRDMEVGDMSRQPASPSSFSGSDDDFAAEANTTSSAQAKTESTPFKKLSKAKVQSLSKSEKFAYKRALLQHRHTEFEVRTAAAEATFARNTLPPSQCTPLQKDITRGLTYFPVNPKKPQYYEKSNNKFRLTEVLKDFRPIRLQDLTIHNFAPAFLQTVPESLWHILKENELFGAYNRYRTTFYQHCAQMPAWTASVTSQAYYKNTFNVEEARSAARDGLSHPHSKSVVSTRTDEAVEGAQRRQDSSEDKNMTKLETRSERRIHRREAQEAREKGTLLPSLQTNAMLVPAPPASAVADTPSHPQSMDYTPMHLDNPDDVPINETVGIDLDQADPMDRELQQKYFPATVDHPATYHCLACGDSCHMTFDCPNFTCTLCGGDHAQSSCPRNQRCRKCRQRGHQERECPEKLALSRGEAVGCDFCDLTDHLEVACHFIWRTFNPRPKEIRKVREVPIYCYSCGATGHYGPECGLSKVRRVLSGGQTFSKANAMKYIDASSVTRNVSAGVDYSIPSRPTKVFNIKGMANDPIDLDASDDEINFISEKVKKPKPHGQISIATPRIGQLLQETNLSYQPNPPEEFRSDYGRRFGGNPTSLVDSTRHGRERTFSPPPRSGIMHYGFSADDRFRPQAQHEDYYEPQPPNQYGYQPANRSSLPGRPPTMSLGNGPRGGGNLGAGRGGGSNPNNRERRKKNKRSASLQGNKGSTGSASPIPRRTGSKKQ